MDEVVIKPSIMDLGQINPTEQRDLWFELTNNTDQELDFKAWAACGCTVPSIVPSRVAAGASAKLKATFNPVGKTGMQEKTLGVTYMINGNQKGAQVTFRAKI